MIEDLISHVFQARDFAHITHLTTRSYAQHMALGAFYDNVVEDIDSIAEAFQGVFGEPMMADDIDMMPKPSQDIITYLASELDYITANRDKISMKDSTLLNLIDGLAAEYSSCLYKLRNLK